MNKTFSRTFRTFRTTNIVTNQIYSLLWRCGNRAKKHSRGRATNNNKNDVDEQQRPLNKEIACSIKIPSPEYGSLASCFFFHIWRCFSIKKGFEIAPDGSNGPCLFNAFHCITIFFRLVVGLYLSACRQLWIWIITHWQTVCIIFFCRFLLSRYYVVTYRRTTWFSQYVVGVGVCSYITVWTKRCACMWVCIDDDEAPTCTVHRTVNSAPQPILARAPKGKYHKFNFKIEAAYRQAGGSLIAWVTEAIWHSFVRLFPSSLDSTKYEFINKKL